MGSILVGAAAVGGTAATTGLIGTGGAVTAGGLLTAATAAGAGVQALGQLQAVRPATLPFERRFYPRTLSMQYQLRWPEYPPELQSQLRDSPTPTQRPVR